MREGGADVSKVPGVFFEGDKTYSLGKGRGEKGSVISLIPHRPQKSDQKGQGHT